LQLDHDTATPPRLHSFITASFISKQFTGTFTRGAKEMVLVFDQVFSPAACAVLHTAACSRALGHALFPREQPGSAIEAALASFLNEVGDSSTHVEYWSRQDWKHIEAHADVDEKHAVATLGRESLRYPRSAHVLYLEVGLRVRGPTCVWEPHASSSSLFGTLTTVPAVAGRVLRFDGRYQHAVPRPADVWLAPFAISQSGGAKDFVRSVILFNTWEEPPMGVEQEAPPESETRNDLIVARCAPRAEWVGVAPRATSDTGSDADCGTMKVWLLGDIHRRGQLERTLLLPVNRRALADALEQSSEVTRLEMPASPPAEALRL
jgi:hypothetical protein